MDDTNNQQGSAPFMPVAPAVPVVQYGDSMQMGGMPPMAPTQQAQAPLHQDASFSSGSLSDFAGMTPPPMPVAPVAPMAPVAPIAPVAPMAPQMPVSMPSYMDTTTQPSVSMPVTDIGGTTPMQESISQSSAKPNQDDYSYAEDILDEILDSLDRIEAKLEALEKKIG